MRPVALLVVLVLLAGPRCKQTKEFRAELDKVRADTGDVMSSATYQRFAARREAVSAMRNALLALAAAESAFVADSGRPTTFFEGKYRFQNDPSNLPPTIQIGPDRWFATISNQHTSMTCKITAMLDTSSGRYHPGAPVCAGAP